MIITNKMEVLGYKYNVENEAIFDRQRCADYYGLPVEPNDITIYWVDYDEAVANTPSFWYIIFHESIRVILGDPITFEVNDELR